MPDLELRDDLGAERPAARRDHRQHRRLRRQAHGQPRCRKEVLGLSLGPRDVVKRNHILVTRARGSEILLAEREARWSLPSIDIPAAHKWWRETAAVNDAVARQYSLDTIVLRCRAVYRREDCTARAAVYLVHNRDETRPAAAGLWINRRRLEQIPFADRRHRALAREAVGETSGTDAGRPMPWEEPGWFDRAAAWLVDQAAASSHPLTGPIVQLRNHGYMSCLLRGPTAQGAIYLKACPSMWSQEPALTSPGPLCP